MELAPIILFVYNRPHHTEQTLEALSKNDLASESELFIYADGPKPNASEEQLVSIHEVRKVIRQKQWCKEVHIVESKTNKGLADSIIFGVTAVLKDFSSVIVLEDDLITSPAFLTYMNKALAYYENYDAVMSISSDIPMKLKLIEPYPYDVFVSLRNFSYGWGTWQNKWEKVDWEIKDYNLLQQNVYLQTAFNRGGEDLWPMLQAQKCHKIDSWAIRFTFAHFIHHSVTIMPTVSFIHHIGFDGSGTHCSNATLTEREINYKTDFTFLPIIYEDSRWIKAFYDTYHKSSSLKSKIKRHILKFTKRFSVK